MPLVRGVVVLVMAVVCAPWLSAQQAAVVPAGGSSFSGAVRPALAQVGQVLNGLNVKKWKAPGSVRSAAQADVDSIQRDLTGMLAGLLEQSDAAPSSVPAGFDVYRNVNALYDTLLRVVETAGLSAPGNEASALDSALSQLEAARSSLGAEIARSMESQQAELARLRTAIAAAAAAPRTPKTTVVEDGPAPATHHRPRSSRKHSTAEKQKEGGAEQKPQ